MDTSHTSALERIARVLAGLALSRNGDGNASSAGEEVDRTWRDHLEAAVSVLNALRLPRPADGGRWRRRDLDPDGLRGPG